MSIERVKDRKVIPQGDWLNFYTVEQYQIMVPVITCSICGEDLLDNDFVFWRGWDAMGFHTSCARHMCLGLLKDIAELTGSLAHDASIKGAKEAVSVKPDYEKALSEANKLISHYSTRIVELQEIIAKRD